MTKGDAEQVEPMKLIFNYNNVFYSFYYDDLGFVDEIGRASCRERV